MKNVLKRKNLHLDGDMNGICYAGKQGDNIVLSFSLYKDGEAFNATGETIVMGVRRNDGALLRIEEYTPGTIYTINNNELDIELPSSAIGSAGRTECELEFTSTTGIFTSNTFYVQPQQKILGNESVLGTDEYNVLKNLIDEVKDLVDDGISNEAIKAAVDAYLDENGVSGGSSLEYDVVEEV